MKQTEPPSNVATELELLKVSQGTAILNIGRTKMYDLINTNQVHRVKIGRATRITLASIQRLVGEG